jgi:hypothetical protein
MTLTIELTPAQERRLRALAAKKGTGEAETARQMLEDSLNLAPEEAPVKRIEDLVGYGFLAHLRNPSEELASEEFARRKQEEIALEERDW